MQKMMIQSIDEGLLAIEQLKHPENLKFIEEVSSLMAKVYRNEGKLIICGNGGSLCEAMHFAEEMTGKYRKMRPGLPAIALADPGHLTCAGNDYGFDEVFSRGIEAHGKKGDLFVGLSTSGNSPNMVRAFEEAKKKGLYTVAFLGRDGGKLLDIADHQIIIKAKHSDRIQEAHMLAIHMLIEACEHLLFPNSPYDVKSFVNAKSVVIKSLVS